MGGFEDDLGHVNFHIGGKSIGDEFQVSNPPTVETDGTDAFTAKTAGVNTDAVTLGDSGNVAGTLAEVYKGTDASTTDAKSNLLVMK
jgi:hypothetical protein